MTSRREKSTAIFASKSAELFVNIGNEHIEHFLLDLCLSPVCMCFNCKDILHRNFDQSTSVSVLFSVDFFENNTDPCTIRAQSHRVGSWE